MSEPGAVATGFMLVNFEPSRFVRIRNPVPVPTRAQQESFVS